MMQPPPTPSRVIASACVFLILALWPMISSAREPQKFALLVGCTEYPYLREQHSKEEYEQFIKLLGPANDVVLFRTLLQERFDFAARDMVTLAGWDEDEPSSRPTRANIEKAFGNLSSKAARGDSVVILMSGHGTYQPLPPGADPGDPSNPEPDGQDELFLPADTKKWLPEENKVENAILDNEIGSWLTRIRKKGALVWIIFDTCHSGTMTRGGARTLERQRYLNPQRLGIPITAAASTVRTRGYGKSPDPADWSTSEPGLVAFYATLPFELAPELPLPKGSPADDAFYHGLLSYTICSVLTQQQSRLTFRELMHQILARYQAVPRFHPTPFGEGDLDREVLGLERWEGRSRILIRKNDPLEINAGSLAGLTPNSVLAVYPPAGSPDPERVLGHVRIVSVSPTSARVEPTAHDGLSAPSPTELAASSRCEVVSFDFGEMRIQLAIQSLTSSDPDQPAVTHPPSALPEASAAVLAVLTARNNATSRLVRITDDLSAAQWILLVRKKEAWLVPSEQSSPGHGATASLTTLLGGRALGPYDLAAPTETAAELSDVFRRIYRWQNLRRIAGSSNELLHDAAKAGLRVEFMSCRDEARTQCSPTAPGAALKVGQRVLARIENRGRLDFDVTLLYLDSSFGIAALFPNPYAQYCRLRPGDPPVSIPLEITGDTQGTEHIFAIAVPSASVGEPADFTWLAQPTLERNVITRGDSRQSPLQTFLETAVFAEGNTRGGLSLAYPDANQPKPVMRLITWETVP